VFLQLLFFSLWQSVSALLSSCVYPTISLNLITQSEQNDDDYKLLLSSQLFVVCLMACDNMEANETDVETKHLSIKDLSPHQINMNMMEDHINQRLSHRRGCCARMWLHIVPSTLLCRRHSRNK